MITNLKLKKDLSAEVTEIPFIFQTSYLQSLDGLRAVSIILVIGAHIGLAYKNYDHLLHPLASLGVQFFFVISGFLITTLLLKEKVNTGTISLRKFYIRRFFRIIPVAYLYLSIVLLLNFVLKMNMSYFSIFLSFLFLRNFSINAKGVNNLSAHYWSLSVEEQFYLIFPVILKKNFKFFTVFLVIMIMAPVVVNIFELTVMSLNSVSEVSRIFVRLLTQFQAIAIGSLSSILIFKRSFKTDFNSSIISPWSLFSFVTIIFLTFLETPFSGLLNIFRMVLFTSVIILNLQTSDTLSFQFLNNKLIKLIGVLSYSLYIWQQPFTYSLTFIRSLSIFQPYKNNPMAYALISLGSVAALLIAGYLSYFFFEKRFLLLKNKYK